VIVPRPCREKRCGQHDGSLEFFSRGHSLRPPFLFLVRGGSAKLLERVEDLLAEIPVLPLDVPVNAEYGALRAELESVGQSIGHNDLFIAAHDCVLGTTLVTANIGEFTRMGKLKVENWLE